MKSWKVEAAIIACLLYTSTLILQFAKNNVAKLTIKGDGETETMTGTWEQNEENIKATFHIDDAIIAINGMLDENYQQIYLSLIHISK